MPTTINASNTSGGAVVTGDGSGVLELQSGGVTALTANGANVTVAGTLTATGGIPQIAASLTSPLAIIGNATAGAEIRLPEDTDNGSNYVALKAANALAANLTLTLPAADGTNGQVLQTNGSGTLSFATPASGSLLRVTVFTSSGTWTKGAGTNYIKVRGVGGGGGGSGGESNQQAGNGSGGGAGGYAEEFINTSGVSTVIETIGSGGSGGAGATNGSGGGTTTFGAYFTCNGGAGGQRNPPNAGDGGTATGGDLNVQGGGGGSGGSVNNSAGSGLGGSSAFGGGGAGLATGGNGTAGKNGTAYGSGGSGGQGNFSGTGGTGGTGAAGVVIVEEYA